MTDHEYYGDDDPRQIRRFVSVATAVGLLVAYVTALPLKWYDLMPDHTTWLEVIAAPAALFGLLAWSAWAPVVFPRRRLLGLVLGVLVVIAVMVGIVLERG